jgi:hypothetical protein
MVGWIRICPGRYLAELTIWYLIANITATFKISRAVDNAGEEIIPPFDIIPGLLRWVYFRLRGIFAYFISFDSRPKPFLCSISPRSEKAVSLIRQAKTSGEL